MAAGVVYILVSSPGISFTSVHTASPYPGGVVKVIECILFRFNVMLRSHDVMNICKAAVCC